MQLTRQRPNVVLPGSFKVSENTFLIIFMLIIISQVFCNGLISIYQKLMVEISKGTQVINL